MGRLLLAAAIAAPAASTAQVAVPPAPPPTDVSSPARPPEPHLLTWRAGEARCDGGPAVPTLAPAPLGSVGVRYAWTRPDAPVRVAFSIDATGRPMDVAIDPSAAGTGADTSDLAPALVASRFAPDAPRTGCFITLEPVRTPFPDADPAAVMAYTIFRNGEPPKAAWDRIKPAGTTCFDPAPDALVRVTPDMREIPQPPATFAWSMVGFDVDARGRPVNVRRVAGTGNEELDRQSLDAVDRSRFVEGERQGCLFPYWRRGEELRMPEPPPSAAFRPEGSSCPGDLPWARRPAYVFPENYRRRGIEGWAIVAYDVAPWGEIGNARLLKAEPAVEFGQTALNMVRGATKQPSSRGYAGCVDRVIFRLGWTGPDVLTRPEQGGEVIVR